MPRKSKSPWWWKARGQWVVNVEGKRYYLGPDQEEAIRQWHELESRRGQVQPQELGDDPFVKDVFDAFLTWVERERAQKTFEWYKQRITDFLSTIADIQVSKLTKGMAKRWSETKKSSTHRRGCIIAVTRPLNWAVNHDLIDKNPIRGIEKPSAKRREVVLTDEQYAKLLSLASDEAFRDLLVFCWETGARPQEALSLHVRHVDLENARCVFPEGEAKNKKMVRVIYLNDTALAVVRRRVEAQKAGHVFLNADGEPWNRNQIACRFGRMEKHLGWMPKLYELRHSWCTRMLKGGNDPITVATMAGHSDPSMLARVYQHLQKDTDHLQAALRKKK